MPPKEPKSPPPAHPIDILPTTLARSYAHLHPALVLATFFFSFPKLVADPVTSLLSSALPLAIQQVFYLVICVPSLNERTINASKRKTPGSGTSTRNELGLSFKTVPALLSLLITLTLTTPLLALTLLLFGAPLTSHQTHTLLAALHLSLLASPALIYIHGLDSNAWRDVVALNLPLDEVMGAAIGTLVGAWVGAVPIPLDWDREWQKWPVTIVSGAYAGWAVGKVLGGMVVRGKKIEIS